MKRTYLSWFLVLTMLLSVFPVSALAGDILLHQSYPAEDVYVADSRAPQYVAKDDSGISWYNYDYATNGSTFVQLTESNKTVTAEARYTLENNASAVLIMALYNKDGRMVSVVMQTVTNRGSEYYTISASYSTALFPNDFVSTKIFVLSNNSTFAPTSSTPIYESHTLNSNETEDLPFPFGF